jgi:hypothetical protein
LEKIIFSGQVWWLKPMILATLETEIGWINTEVSPREKVLETPSHWAQWFLLVIPAT